MNIYILIFLMIFFLIFLLYFDYNDIYLPKVILKTITSSIFVIIAIYSYKNNQTNNTYFILLLTALILCAIGDVLMCVKTHDKSSYHYIYGITAFACAHIIFSTAFIYISEFSITPLIISFIISLLFIYLFKNIESLNFNGIFNYISIYIFIIISMYCFSLNLLSEQSLTSRRILLTTVGTTLFVISDLFLAFNKFGNIKYKKILGSINLITYYTGQVLISLSLLY